MFIDPDGFHLGPRPRPREPRPRQPRPGERTLVWLLVALALALMVLPVSLASFGDVVRAVRVRRRLAPNTAMLYHAMMHTVAETVPYLRAAKAAGLTEEDRAAIVTLLAVDPMAGEVMPGCGGARKLRFARPGHGKSGGYRVVSYYAGVDMPVFLLTVFPKNVKASLSQAERNAFAQATKALRGSYMEDLYG